MPTPDDRLRQPPAERFAGPEHRVELTQVLGALRSEPHDGKDKHRQITIFRRGELRLVLFAFEAGGRLAAHHAPGFVVVHALRGAIQVQTPSETHELTAGQMVVLDPAVVHDVAAHEEADVLLTVSLTR